MSASTHKPHIPVLLDEVIDALALEPGAVVVDGTFGAGGYSRAALAAKDVTVLGIDRDPRAIAIGRAFEREFPGRFIMLPGNFSQMERLVKARAIETVDCVMLDIGVSSMQLDDPARGFSFQADGDLDMRMSGEGETAADVVNSASEQDLADILYHYGEEPKARRISKAIVKARAEKPITRTLELAAIVRSVTGFGRPGHHPATKTFQALRIYVNRELEELARGLSAAERLLKAGGRLVVVTFHSLEARLVKRFLSARSGKEDQIGPSRHLPLAQDRTVSRAPSFALIGRKAVGPGEEEIAANPRARSAQLRAAIRTEAPAWPEEEAA